ncbi:hypothetical protein ABPG72_006877 [Tetrahymena utriculariae]
MISNKDMKSDLKKIQQSLEEIDKKMDLLKDKKRVLLKTKQKIVDIYRQEFKSGQAKQEKIFQKPSQKEDQGQSADDNPDKYIFKSGRRLYTDAYKNYIVKLCEIYNLKSIEKYANVLYTNIIRWRIEMQRGQIPIDDSYKPNEAEIQQLKQMEKYADKHDYDYQMKKQMKQYEQQKMDQELDDNKMSSTNSNDIQEEYQLNNQQNLYKKMYDEDHFNQKQRHSVKQYQEDTFASSNECSPDGNKQNNSEQPYLPNGFNLDKVLEVNPNFNSPWYTKFESQLVKSIVTSQEPVNQRSIMATAKHLRKSLNIPEQDLKFTKEWYYDLLARRNIQSSQ